MFIKLIYKRLGWKENIYIMGIIYGVIYAALFIIMITLSELFLGEFNLKRNFVYSLVLFMIMFFVYQIKYAIFEKRF